MEMVTVEDILDGTSGDIGESNRQYIADYHDNEMEDYYEEAESENNLNIFWDVDSVFYQMFLALNLDRIVELACGHGRHVEKYKGKAGNIVLVDILPKNICYCKERFRDQTKIRYYINNGYDLRELDSGAYSAMFSYDAMVHFEMMDIFGYLKEAQRILQPGGRALFHHSNNTEDYKISFSTGTKGRNYMSAQLFAYLANRAGLEVINQKLIDWENVKGLDCLTLVEKR